MADNEARTDPTYESLLAERDVLRQEKEDLRIKVQMFERFIQDYPPDKDLRKLPTGYMHHFGTFNLDFPPWELKETMDLTKKRAAIFKVTDRRDGKLLYTAQNQTLFQAYQKQDAIEEDKKRKLMHELSLKYDSEEEPCQFIVYGNGDKREYDQGKCTCGRWPKSGKKLYGKRRQWQNHFHEACVEQTHVSKFHKINGRVAEVVFDGRQHVPLFRNYKHVTRDGFDIDKTSTSANYLDETPGLFRPI